MRDNLITKRCSYKFQLNSGWLNLFWMYPEKYLPLSFVCDSLSFAIWVPEVLTFWLMSLGFGSPELLTDSSTSFGFGFSDVEFLFSSGVWVPELLTFWLTSLGFGFITVGSESPELDTFVCFLDCICILLLSWRNS